MKQINKMVDHSPEKRKRCYIQARSFLFAAKRCGRVELCEESGLNQNLPIPEYVNIAFSCELYLKALIYKDNETIKLHDLSKLFSLLDAAKIHRVSEILKMDEVQIKNLLEHHSKLFENMRYRFEYPEYSGSFSVPLQFFYLMAESLDQLAQETISVEPYPSTNVDIGYFYEF